MHKCLQTMIIVFVMVASWASCGAADSQPPSGKIDKPDPGASAKEFERWVSKVHRWYGPKDDPTRLERTVLQRLERGLYTTDQTVLKTVDQRQYYEASQVYYARRPGEPIDYKHPETLDLIDQLLPLLYGRDLLRAQLHRKKAMLSDHGDVEDPNVAAEEEKKALALLHELHLKVDQERMAGMKHRANVLYDLGRIDEAESLYLDVMSYSWTLVTDVEARNRLRTLYVRAVRGLLRVRQGDVEALQEIFIFPATDHELRPLIDRAIERAKNMPDKLTPDMLHSKPPDEE